MFIKKCSKNEIASVMALENESLRKHLAFDRDFYRISRKYFKIRATGFLKALHDSKSRIFVALQNRDVIGFVYGYITKFGKLNVGILHDIVVSQKHKRQGIGKALATSILGWFCSKKCIESHLDVNLRNSEAIGFYESIGFRPHEYKMRLKLSKKRFSPFS
jgi:ribosomal protein S18 acetylase RimI-like enzyme